VVLVVESVVSDVLARLDRLGMERTLLGDEVRIVRCDSAAAAAVMASSLSPALVLLDLRLRDASGLQGLTRLRATCSAPVVVIGDEVDASLATRLLQAGAHEVLVRPLPDDPTLLRVLAMAIERHRAQGEHRELVRQAQRAAFGREHLMRVVSHDLQNPLHAIRLCVAALRPPAPAPADRPGEPSAAAWTEALQVIAQSVEWMAQLTSDLLDRTSLEGGKLVLHPRWMRVAALMRETHGMFHRTAQQAGITLTIGDASALPDIFADPRRLRQVLSNLVANALNSTPRGGSVTLTAQLAVRTPQEARVASRGVRFSVTDTGPGIAVDELARLFDWSWTVPRRGSADRERSGGASGWGIGLAIAKGLVEAHGSALHVSSIDGHGTTISFVISPRGTVESTVAIPWPASSPPAPRSVLAAVSAAESS
jgi:signal transduction histidine kinase